MQLLPDVVGHEAGQLPRARGRARLRAHAEPARGSGRFFDAEDVRLQRRVAFIGSEVALKVFGNAPAVGEHIRIKGMPFEVIGVQKEKVQLSNYNRPDKQCVFIPYTTAAQLWNTEYVNMLVYQAIDATLDARATSQVKEVLGSRLRFNPPTSVPSARSGRLNRRRSPPGIVLGLKLVLTFIGVLTLAIGGVGVMNIMFVSVNERTREIGLRKALGARRCAILLQFLLEGLVTTFAGGAAGVLISYVLVWLLSPRPFLSELLDDATRGVGHSHDPVAGARRHLHGDPDGGRPGQLVHSGPARRADGPHRSAAVRIVRCSGRLKPAPARSRADFGRFGGAPRVAARRAASLAREPKRRNRAL